MLEVILWIVAVFVVLALAPLMAAILIGRAERRRASRARAASRHGRGALFGHWPF